MSRPGSESNPLRVAIVGAGPTGFYAADHLIKSKIAVEIDIFDKLPTPYGLVRFGVAPDHQKIKTVTKAFDRTASKPNVRFFGNVKFGRDIALEDMRRFYHQIIFTTGAQSDRKMGIPGEDLPGSHPATEFVAWYNGHPDFRDYKFDLSQERAAVVGVGNVAMDVARILTRTPEELAQTDIAGYALEALSQSKIKEVYILGRRGPAQAAFTNPEIKELGEMADADIFVLPAEAELDPISQDALDASKDRATAKKVEIIQSYARPISQTDKSRRLILRFLVSPVELYGSETDGVTSMKLVHNQLYLTDAGALRPKATGKFEEIPIGLVFRSVGYRGVPLPGVPFNNSWGVILNEKGRVIDLKTQDPVIGLYTAGWIKRGPSGVIGTNKPDAVETVGLMLNDLSDGATLEPELPQLSAVERFIKEQQPNYFSFADWLKLDAIEVARGQELGRPRLKFTCVAEMLNALGR
jgi:ferredoxin--NADP+ reductase